METPEFVQQILSAPTPDYGHAVAVLICEVDHQVRSGEDVDEIGRVLQECIPDHAAMARVLAVTLRNIPPPGQKGNGHVGQ